MSLTSTKCNLLHVANIYHIILDCLSEPYPDYDNCNLADLVQIRPPQREGQRALATLAQTCRMFSGPSLNCLWRKLDSLRPLLRCLFTNEIVDAGENLRPPSLADWSIINRYSHRIQELEVCDDQSLFLLECSAFEPNLLPNLTVLSWDLVDLYLSLAFIRPLLGPQLVSFNLGLDLESGDHKELTSFLKTLPLHCPGLKFVSLGIFLDGDDAESISPVLSRAVCGFEKLDRLAIHTPIDGVTMRHLVMSPQFSQIFLTIRQSQVEELSLLPSDTPFSGAKKVGLSGLDLGSITSLLRSEGQMFSSTEFHLAVSPTSQLTLSFFTALASHPRRSSLQSLTLDWDHPPIADPEPEDNHDILSRDALQPLGFFRNLRELSIDLKNPISINDEELVDLARGWPLLRFLRLVSGNGLSTKHITLQGLLLLVDACPQLESVGLCVDASEVPTRGVGIDVRSTSVKELHFPGSPINDPRLVAKFLLKHFPSIICVLGPRWSLREEYAKEWLRVRRYLKRKDKIKPLKRDVDSK